MLTLKISGLLMFYEEFFMKNVWELASIVARLSCENKYLSRGILEGHQTRTDIFCCWLPRDTEDHSTWFSHSESSLHLKNGVGRNFYHRDVDESFCHLQWFCGELQSWCKMRYLWFVCIWFIMPFSTVIISLWALQGACCHWYLAKTHIHSYKVGESLKILIWNNSLATQFFKYI